MMVLLRTQHFRPHPVHAQKENGSCLGAYPAALSLGEGEGGKGGSRRFEAAVAGLAQSRRLGSFMKLQQSRTVGQADVMGKKTGLCRLKCLDHWHSIQKQL